MRERTDYTKDCDLTDVCLHLLEIKDTIDNPNNPLTYYPDESNHTVTRSLVDIDRKFERMIELAQRIAVAAWGILIIILVYTIRHW